MRRTHLCRETEGLFPRSPTLTVSVSPGRQHPVPALPESPTPVTLAES